MKTYKILLPESLVLKSIVNQDARTLQAIIFRYGLSSTNGIDYTYEKLKSKDIANLCNLNPGQVSVKTKDYKISELDNLERYVFMDMVNHHLEVPYHEIYDNFLKEEMSKRNKEKKSISLSIEILQELFQCGRNTIIRIKNDLEQAGYLQWVKPNPGKNSNVIAWTTKNGYIYAADFVNMGYMGHRHLKFNQLNLEDYVPTNIKDYL